MDLSPDLLNQVLGQGVFAGLFVWLLISERKNSQEREDKLMIQLDKSNDVYENVMTAVNALKDTIMKTK